MTQFFKKRDLFVYAVLIALIAVITAVFLPAQQNKVTGFEVYCDNQLVFSYDTQKKSYNILSDKCTVEEIRDGILLTITQPDGQKNTVAFDTNGAKMLESNCSNTKECVNNFPHLDTDGAIICIPNRIKIIARTQNNAITVPSGKIHDTQCKN